MTRFGKKSLIWLVAGSLVVAAGAAAWRVTEIGAAQAKESLRQVEKSEADLGRLKTQLAQWEKAHPPGSLVGKASVRIEPVALSADFSPHELPGMGQVLAGMYVEHGFLSLKSFSLDIGTGGTAHVAMAGDKMFVKQ